MLEMGELSMERFRGIFKLTYNGDAHIVLQTKVQVHFLDSPPGRCSLTSLLC